MINRSEVESAMKNVLILMRSMNLLLISGLVVSCDDGKNAFSGKLHMANGDKWLTYCTIVLSEQSVRD